MESRALDEAQAHAGGVDSQPGVCIAARAQDGCAHVRGATLKTFLGLGGERKAFRALPQIRNAERRSHMNRHSARVDLWASRVPLRHSGTERHEEPIDVHRGDPDRSGGRRCNPKPPGLKHCVQFRDNSFLIEEAYNQEAGVVPEHINSFLRARDGSWVYTFTRGVAAVRTEEPNSATRSSFAKNFRSCPVLRPESAISRSTIDTSLSGVANQELPSLLGFRFFRRVASLASNSGAGGAGTANSISRSAS